MARCPSCFQHLPTDRYAFICTNPSCREEADNTASGYFGREIKQRRIIEARQSYVGSDPPVPSCDRCSRAMTEQACPECHHGPLVPGWRGAHTTCIAMAGARATGKSFYIAIAIRQLELLLTKLRQSVDFADESSRRNYIENYEKPLLQERGIIQATPSAEIEGAYQRDPLVLAIGRSTGQRRYLVLRDVAGEDLEKETSDITQLRFFAHADTVVFMFDPKRVNQVRELLRGVDSQEDRMGGDPRVVLSNVLRAVGDGSPNIAVVLAKFDTMHKLRKVQNSAWSRVMSNSGAAALRDPGLSSPQYDEQDAGLLDAEVRSMLQRLDAESFMLALDHPPRGTPFKNRFFAVSVLGESISGGRVHSRGIAPFRCLDPLRWALTLNGAV